LGTGEREICEAARLDWRWGIGYGAKEALDYRENWGENLLGKAIVRVRGRIRERLREVGEGKRVVGDWDLPGEEMWDEIAE
jgi:hypothetical protein